MAFKTTKAVAISVESPEALLRDLRSKTIPGPLAHQADLWRAYQDKALNVPDVALQLPTGVQHDRQRVAVGVVLNELPVERAVLEMRALREPARGVVRLVRTVLHRRRE